MRFPGDTRRSFARGTKYSEVLDAICLKHPQLSDVLLSHNKELGFKLTGLESEILIRIILTMKEKGIVALPLHDGIFVKRSVRAEAIRIMARVTTEYVGFPIKTSVIDMNVEYHLFSRNIKRWRGPEIMLLSCPNRRRSLWLLRTKSRVRVVAAYRTLGLDP